MLKEIYDCHCGEKMKYNPDRHHRKSIRLKHYDYSQAGAYFVTICTKDRKLFFEDEFIKSIAETFWKEMPKHFINVKLDEFIIMPNHLHGIIIIENDIAVGTGHRPVQIGHRPVQNRFQNPGKGSLSTIIGSYKSITIRTINEIVGTGHCPVQIGQGNALPLREQKNFAWQPRFYEHIIRDEIELNKIREYIINNPLKWELDIENPERIKS